MTLKCDHCRGNLGPRIHRYWQMRFCSQACVAAYQHRLGEDTRMKIKRLDFATPERPIISPAKIDFRWLNSVIRQLPG
jgi:hypothetical protein